MSMREILQVAKGFIERGYTKQYFARNGNDAPVDSKDPNAVCWCAAGAVRRAVPKGVQSELMEYDALYQLRLSLPEGASNDLVEYNDRPTTTKEDILALFDRAIASIGDAS